MPDYTREWSAQFLDQGGAGHHAQGGLFKAQGDGATDDSTAFVNWLTAIPAGGVGILRPGATYIVDNVDLGALGKDGVTIIGRGATIKKKTTGGTYGNSNVEHMFRDRDGTMTNFTVIGVTFDASRASATNGDTVSPFFFSRTNGLTFIDCTFKDGIEEGVKAYKCQDVRFQGCHFTNIRNNGIQCTNVASDSHTGSVADQGFARWRILDCTFDTIDDGNNGAAEGQGVTFNSTTSAVTGEDVVVARCVFTDCIRGIWTEFNTASTQGQNFTFVDNTVRGSISYGIGVVGVWTAVVSNNRCYNIGSSASTSSETAAFVFSGSGALKSRDVEAHGNIAIDDRGGSAEMDYGFRILQIEDSTIIGGRVRGAVIASYYVDATATDCQCRMRNPDVKFRGERSSVQSISNNTWTVVDWNQSVSDEHGLWDGANDRIGEDMLPGTYLVVFGISFSSNATGRRGIRIVADNGTTERTLAEVNIDTCSSDDWSYAGAARVDKTHDEWIEVQVFQNSGGNLNLRGADAVFVEAHLIEGSE